MSFAWRTMASFKAQVLYDFRALDGDQLDVNAGQIVTILDAEPDLNGWALAENGRRDGYIPIDYVQALDPMEDNGPKRKRQSTMTMPSTSTVPSIPAPNANATANPTHSTQRVVALNDTLPPKVAIPTFREPDVPDLTATCSATSSSTPSLRSPTSNSSDTRSKGSTSTTSSGTTVSNPISTGCTSHDRGLLSLLDSNSKESTASMSTVYAPQSAARSVYAQQHRQDRGHHQQTTPFMPNYGALRGTSRSVTAQRYDPMNTMQTNPVTNSPNSNVNGNRYNNTVNTHHSTHGVYGTDSMHMSPMGHLPALTDPVVNPMGNSGANPAPFYTANAPHVPNAPNCTSNYGHSNTMHSVHGHDHRQIGGQSQFDCTCCPDPNCMDCNVQCNAIHYNTAPPMNGMNGATPPPMTQFMPSITTPVM